MHLMPTITDKYATEAESDGKYAFLLLSSRRITLKAFSFALFPQLVLLLFELTFCVSRSQ